MSSAFAFVTENFPNNSFVMLFGIFVVCFPYIHLVPIKEEIAKLGIAKFATTLYITDFHIG